MVDLLTLPNAVGEYFGVPERQQPEADGLDATTRLLDHWGQSLVSICRGKLRR